MAIEPHTDGSYALEPPGDEFSHRPHPVVFCFYVFVAGLQSFHVLSFKSSEGRSDTSSVVESVLVDGFKGLTFISLKSYLMEEKKSCT